VQLFTTTPNNNSVIPAIPQNGMSTSSALQEYSLKYSMSIDKPEDFWREQALRYLSWFNVPQHIHSGTFAEGDISWFNGGKLNAAYNCIDRHLRSRGNQVAIIWESDEPGRSMSVTYSKLAAEVSRIANMMKSKGVQKGDVVTIFMPMTPGNYVLNLICFYSQ
jgi:acetyl-CoA synthetase